MYDVSPKHCRLTRRFHSAHIRSYRRSRYVNQVAELMPDDVIDHLFCNVVFLFRYTPSWHWHEAQSSVFIWQFCPLKWAIFFDTPRIARTHTLTLSHPYINSLGSVCLIVCSRSIFDVRITIVLSSIRNIAFFEVISSIFFFFSKQNDVFDSFVRFSFCQTRIVHIFYVVMRRNFTLSCVQTRAPERSVAARWSSRRLVGLSSRVSAVGGYTHSVYRVVRV